MTIKSRTILLLGFFLCVATPLMAATDLFSYTALQLPYGARASSPWYQVIQTQEEWAQLYTSLIPSTVEPTADVRTVPVIDFANYTLIAGGVNNSAGRYLVMGKLVDLSDTLYVNVGRVDPGPHCVVAAGLSIYAPTMAILVRKTTKKIQIYVDPLLFNCG